MLVLIYILSIISDQEKAFGEERLDVKITNCVDENGELVELPFIENGCIYTLNLCQKEENCFLSFDLIIKFSSLVIIYKRITPQLVKCTENISLKSFHNDFVVEFNNQSNIYNIKSDFSQDPYSESTIITQRVNIAFNSHYHDYRKEKCHSNDLCYCIDCWNKSKSITQFRKELGIIGDKIKTTKFKF
ncbi:hypothetical protein CDIK_4158, partial [Cucumispora dikerogammari]